MARFAVIGVIITLFIILVRVLFPSSKNKGVPAAEEMVQDPNCETFLPKNEAVHQSVEGEDYYFCGERCAQEFKEKKS